nr:hypothetical protein [Tanacetum cinerariifolium]
MDLFDFIRHADPTKVLIGEKQIKKDMFLYWTLLWAVLFLLLVKIIGREDRSEGKDHVGQDEPATILVDEEVQVVAADKPKGIRKKRKATGGASGSNHPLKKLRKDHGTSSNVNASTGGKSLIAIQCLLERSTLNVEGSGDTDSISGPNLRTQHPSERFIIFSDSSHHFSANAADAEVSSFVRSSILPPLVMTVVVTTTIITDTSSVLALRADAELVTQVYQSPFTNSTSIGTVGPNIAGPSNLVGTKFYTDAFYVSQEIDSETLRQIYVPKCNMVNESVLDDPDIAARQTCVVAEVRMWSEHNLRERKRFERRCVRQIIGHGLRLAIMRCHQSPEYAAAFVVVIGLTIDKGIQAGLVAGIDHEKSRRGLAAVASYDPFVEARYVFVVQAFRELVFNLLPLFESLKDASIADIMNSLCLEGPSAKTLELKEGALSHRLSNFNTMRALVDPLSSENLIGEVSTLGVPATVAATTALSISVTAVNVSENRMSSLLDLIMVQCAHRTCGISSILSLLPLSNHAYIPSSKLLFTLSTKQLACGCLKEAKH